jgi:hypothetical protein
MMALIYMVISLHMLTNNPDFEKLPQHVVAGEEVTY